MTEVVLAFDAGTSGGRVALFDREGHVLGAAAVRWQPSGVPALAPFGQVYEAPETLRERLFGAAREMLGAADHDIEVCAVAIGGARIACGFIDASGETLYLGPNGDIRAIDGAELDDLSSDSVYMERGRFPPFLFAPARLRWFAARAPEVFARVRYVLSFPDWFAHGLGASPHIDPTLGADLMMLDVQRRTRATIDDDARYPPLVSAGTRIGELSEQGARALGLTRGIPIVAGAGDTQLALLGAGLSTAGTAVVAGSTAPVMRIVAQPLEDKKRRLWLGPHVIDTHWTLEANLGEMGSAHAWLCELLLGHHESWNDPGAIYETAEALARTAPIGCDGASAHLGPRAMDLRALNTARPAALLMPFGETRGGTPAGRGALLRASFESAAFAIRSGSEWLDELAEDASPLVLTGGMSRSSLLGEIVAAVLARPVVRADPDATLRGAAACAAVGAGWYESIAEASRRLAGPSTTCVPDEDDIEAYEDAFERWVEREAELEEF